MKTSFFKRHLAFYLSTALVLCSSPSFAVKPAQKKVQKTAPQKKGSSPSFTVKTVQNKVSKQVSKSTTSRQMLKRGRRKVEYPGINNIFTIPEDKEQDFYIRRRKIHKKDGGQIVYGFVTPNILKDWKNEDIQLLSKDNFLPSETRNPCDTLYPFLVASLLRFAPYLLEPYNGGYYHSLLKNYYLSFAHIYSCNPSAVLILPGDLPKLNKNLVELRNSLGSLLSKVYRDENGKKWTAVELANITVYLHAVRISKCMRQDSIDKLKTILDSDGMRNISDMVDPLIDIVYKTSLSKWGLTYDTKKPLSKAYKEFYLDIVKAIDPDLKDKFQLLDDDKTIKSEIKEVTRIIPKKSFPVQQQNQSQMNIQPQTRIQLQSLEHPQLLPQAQDQIQIQSLPFPQPQPQDQIPLSAQFNLVHNNYDDSLSFDDSIPLPPGLGFGGFGRFGYMYNDDMNS